MRLKAAVAEATQRCLRDCLMQAQGNMTQAAKLAGLNREWFYTLCYRHNVRRKPRPVKAKPIFTWKPPDTSLEVPQPHHRDDG